MEHEKHMKRCYELAVRAGKKGFDTLVKLRQKYEFGSIQNTLESR